MRHTFKHYLKHYSFYLGGDQAPVVWVERLRSVFGAFLGLMNFGSDIFASVFAAFVATTAEVIQNNST
jgi:hypothetical protein